MVNDNHDAPRGRWALLRALRPHQWLKNLFVAAPLVFARRADDLSADLKTAAAMLAFCMLSSAVYLFNDLADVEKDRVHPSKRHRPIASGALSPAIARGVAFALAGAGLAAAVAIGFPVLAVAGGYLALNAAYTLALKRVAFVDVACISVMFLLRVLAGAVAIPVEPSRWLLVCTLLLAALLGFGKRAHELGVSGASSEAQRDVLGTYRLSTLRSLLLVLGTLTTTTYLSYTQSDHALSFFGTRNLVFTVPFVAFGVFRFIGMTRKVDAESPTDSMLRDPLFVTNLLLYGVAVFLVIYLR